MTDRRQRIGPYVVLRKLGEGGAGTVFLARHEVYEHTRAIKVLRRELLADRQAIERFRRECKTLLSLNHPNIIRVYDPGVTGDAWFLPMEYVAGRSLAETMSTGSEVSFEQKLDWGIQLLDALHAAHEEGIVHRDIKPSNLLIQDQAGILKVVDFGISARPGALDDRNEKGTFGYQAPEQIMGSGEIDASSDIFSAGIVLYELFTGRHPFDPNKVRIASELNQAILRGETLPVNEVNPELPQNLGQVIARSLERQPRDRFRSAKEMLCGLMEVKGPSEDPTDKFITEGLAVAERAVKLKELAQLENALSTLDRVLTLQPEQPRAIELYDEISKILAEYETSPQGVAAESTTQAPLETKEAEAESLRSERASTLTTRLQIKALENERRLEEAIKLAHQGDRERSLQLFMKLRAESPGDPSIVQAARSCGLMPIVPLYAGLDHEVPPGSVRESSRKRRASSPRRKRSRDYTSPTS